MLFKARRRAGAGAVAGAGEEDSRHCHFSFHVASR